MTGAALAPGITGPGNFRSAQHRPVRAVKEMSGQPVSR